MTDSNGSRSGVEPRDPARPAEFTFSPRDLRNAVAFALWKAHVVPVTHLMVDPDAAERACVDLLIALGVTPTTRQDQPPIPLDVPIPIGAAVPAAAGARS